MANFTDQKRRIATEEDCKALWGGAKNGEQFHCGICGYKFKVGDGWRWVYAGSIAHANFFVCDECDGKDVLEKRKNIWKEFCRLKKILDFE